MKMMTKKRTPKIWSLHVQNAARRRVFDAVGHTILANHVHDRFLTNVKFDCTILMRLVVLVHVRDAVYISCEMVGVSAWYVRDVDVHSSSDRSKALRKQPMQP